MISREQQPANSSGETGGTSIMPLSEGQLRRLLEALDDYDGAAISTASLVACVEALYLEGYEAGREIGPRVPPQPMLIATQPALDALTARVEALEAELHPPLSATVADLGDTLLRGMGVTSAPLGNSGAPTILLYRCPNCHGQHKVGTPCTHQVEAADPLTVYEQAHMAGQVHDPAGCRFCQEARPCP